MDEEKGFDIDARIAELEREFGSGEESPPQQQSQSQQQAPTQEHDWSKKPEDYAQTQPEQPQSYTQPESMVQEAPREQPIQQTQETQPEPVQQSQYTQPEQTYVQQSQPEQKEPADFAQFESATQTQETAPVVIAEQKQPETTAPVQAEKPQEQEWSPETALKELEKEKKEVQPKVYEQKKSNGTNRNKSNSKGFIAYISSNSFFDAIMLVALAGVTLLFISQFAYFFLGYEYSSVEILTLLGTIITLLCGIYFIVMVFVKKQNYSTPVVIKQEVNQAETIVTRVQNEQQQLLIAQKQRDQQVMQNEIEALRKELAEAKQNQQNNQQATNEKQEKEKIKLEAERKRLEERNQKTNTQLSKAKNDRERKNLEQELHDIEHAMKTLDSKYAALTGQSTKPAKEEFSHSRYALDRKKFEEELAALKLKRQELLNDKKQAQKQLDNTESRIDLAKSKRDVITEKEKLLKQQGHSDTDAAKAEKARLEVKHNEQNEQIKDLQAQKLRDQELVINIKEKFTEFEKQVLEVRTRIFTSITQIKEESKECFDILKQMQQTLTSSMPLMKNPNPKVKPVSQTVYDILAKKKKNPPKTTNAPKKPH